MSLRQFVLLSAASINYTIKVYTGSTAYLRCYFPRSSQVNANALWYKVTGDKMTQLNTEDDSTADNRVELLYPLDHDQTIIIKNMAEEDAGIYLCQSAEEEVLSSLHVFVEGICCFTVHVKTRYFYTKYNI